MRYAIDLLVTLMYNLNATIPGNDKFCSTPLNEAGHCIPLQLCPKIQEGVLRLDDAAIELAKQSLCDSKPNEKLVCCPTTNTADNTQIYNIAGNYSFPQIQTNNFSFNGDNQDAVGHSDTLVPVTSPTRNTVLSTSSTSTYDDSQNQTISNPESTTERVILNATTTRSQLDNPQLTTYAVDSEEPKIQNSNVSTNASLPNEDLDVRFTNSSKLLSKMNSQTITTPRNSGTKLPSKEICGYQHSDDRFDTGEETAIDEFPWLVSMKYTNTLKNDGRKQFEICTGTIITHRHVLSTASCIKLANLQGYYLKAVILGEYNINETSDCTTYEEYEDCADPIVTVNVESVIYHKSHTDFNDLRFDIALIQLESYIKFTDYVRPICLPTPGTTLAKPGDILFTTGWGTTTVESDVRTAIKKRGYGTLLPTDFCETYKSPEFYLLVVDNKYHLCFLEGPNGACNHDSGGPLMFSVRGQWHIEGIWTYPATTQCGEGTPTVYTKIAEFVEWIEDNI